MSRPAKLWRDFLCNPVHASTMQRRYGTQAIGTLEGLGYTLERRPSKHLYCFGLRLPASEVRELIGGRYG